MKTVNVLFDTEVESSVISHSSIPAQSAPSIMRKRGYEHINGVEGNDSVPMLSKFMFFVFAF